MRQLSTVTAIAAARMRRLLPPLAAFTLLPGVAALAPAAPAVAAPWQLERSDVVTVPGPEGDDYRVMISWPEGDPPAGGWPVLWLLDGETHFPTATLMARRTGRGRGGASRPAGIIVAIEAGPVRRRSRDYTPSVAGYAIPGGVPGTGLPTGGADAFLTFLEKDVRPLVERRWRTDPARQALMGHSFGGLLALHALARGKAWTRYVAISPSLWFGNGVIRQELEQANLPAGRSLLIAHGDAERGGRGEANAAASPETLAADLTARGVKARYELLVGQSHGSTMAAAMGDGIAIAFAAEAP